MEIKRLNKLYLSAVRSRRKNGARWQKVSEVPANKVGQSDGEDAYYTPSARGEFAPGTSVTTMMRNKDVAREVKARVHKLLDLATQILTERQYAVFVLVAVKDPALTEREVAKVLSISPGRVHQLSVAAMAKLRRAYDERT